MGMKSKIWLSKAIGGLMAAIIFAGAVTVYIDPFFHYHRPLIGLSYFFDDHYEAYMNDGIAKNYAYDTLITGTSMTTNFKTEEIDELFQSSSIRLTYQGEGFKRINEGIQTAIDNNPNLKLVIRGLDDMWFISDPEYLGKEEYPFYLYDGKWWNDLNYIYNADVFLKMDIPVILRTLRGTPAETMDSHIPDSVQKGTKEQFLSRYKRTEREIKDIDPEETRIFFDMLDRNLQQNVISSIENNPDIIFYVFFPPYSICWWDSLNQLGTGVLKRRIDLEEFAIEKLLQYENVRLFSFHNHFDLICDLGNYTDETHYNSAINSEILKWMAEGKYELTSDNYKQYIDEIADFYCNYDYDAIYE